MQPLGHLQPRPVHCDRCDEAQHDAQAAEHREHHGVAGLVEGTLLGLAENEAGILWGGGRSSVLPLPWPRPWGCQTHLAEGAVPGHGAQGQGTVSPLGQPVVDDHQDHVLEQLGEDQQREEQDAGRGQVLGTGPPRDLGTLVQHR